MYRIYYIYGYGYLKNIITITKWLISQKALMVLNDEDDLQLLRYVQQWKSNPAD